MVGSGKWLVVAALSLALSGCAHQTSETGLGGDASYSAKASQDKSRGRPATASTPAAAVPGIQWLSDYQAGLSQAQQQGKPLMVEVSAAWCSACKRLEEEVLSRPDVIAASRAFVPVRVDGDRRPDLKKQFGVSGYPTVIFLRDGKEVGRVRGAVPYQAMLKEMERAGRSSG